MPLFCKMMAFRIFTLSCLGCTSYVAELLAHQLAYYDAQRSGIRVFHSASSYGQFETVLKMDDPEEMSGLLQRDLAPSPFLFLNL